jgi:CHAD domain-containing protein
VGLHEKCASALSLAARLEMGWLSSPVMPYRVRRHEPVGELFDRLVAEELGRAFAASANPALDLEERVHELRTRLKKARAVVRLVRAQGGRPGRRARRDDHWMRDVARTLARGREALVAPHTLQALRRRNSKSSHQNVDLLRLIDGAETAARRQLSGPALARMEKALHAAAAALHGHRSRLAAHPLSHPRRVLFDGLAASYRDARRTLAKLPPEPAPELLHHWRTQIKRLGYQLRLLRRIAPAVWRGLGAPLDKLGDQLGDAHDLVILETWIAGDAPISGPSARARLTAAITNLRQQREREARAAGEKLLKEKPAAFEKKLKKAWRKRR